MVRNNRGFDSLTRIEKWSGKMRRMCDHDARYRAKNGEWASTLIIIMRIIYLTRHFCFAIIVQGIVRPAPTRIIEV